MRNSFLVVLIAFILFSCTTEQKTVNNMYSNPILSGFYPDPSICRVGEDYYMVNSTFSFFPGLPIFHSTDLVNWTQIGNVINRKEQIDYDGLDISEGLYAPTLRYYNEKFYLVCTRVGGIENFVVSETGNFVVTADSPEGPWSNPVYLPYVDGIDPDLFFDDNGKAYITSCASPDSLIYKGHRAIKMHEFDTETLTTSEETVTLVNGGTDISKQPIWVEGPHIYKINDYYYLFCAEGGTSTQHSEVVFRSESVDGPYLSYSKNPILTQRHLPEDRANPIINSGHADIVQTQTGEWWAVFLACRPYDSNYFNIGRETFMLPLKWENNWPVLLSKEEVIPLNAPLPNLPKMAANNMPLSGDMALKDNFNYTTLPYHWLHIRTPKELFYTLDSANGGLTLNLLPEKLSEKTSPAFIGRRQQHQNFSIITSLNFSPQNEGEMAGITAYQNEKHYYFLARTLINKQECVALFKGSESGEVLIQKAEIDESMLTTCQLQIEMNSTLVHFKYSRDGKKWESLAENIDSKYLSTQKSGGFVGTIVGMHATSSGEQSAKKAHFEWFEYLGDD